MAPHAALRETGIAEPHFEATKLLGYWATGPRGYWATGPLRGETRLDNGAIRAEDLMVKGPNITNTWAPPVPNLTKDGLGFKKKPHFDNHRITWGTGILCYVLTRVGLADLNK